MIYKNHFLKFVLLIILISPSIGYSQFCTNAVVPPTTINSIKVTATSTGSVSIFSRIFTSCDVYTTPINSISLGASGAFTYTLNFSFPVNNLDFTLVGTGGSIGILKNEVFTFTTNAGIPSIVDQGSCFSTIANNVLASGLGAPLTGGGNFTLVNANAFTSLTISGAGGQAGSVLAFCSSSIVTKIDITKEICAGDSVLIGGMYEKEAGLYADTLFGGSATGEDSIVVTNLILNPISVDLGNDTILCLGETVTLDASTANASYLWQDNSTNPTFNVSKQGTYWVQITANNCSATDTIQVSYNPLAAIDLGSNTVLCLGETLTLDASTANASYLWQDNSTNPTFNVSQQGTYWAEVTVNNCNASDTILINERDCEILLEMPTIFTPNNDGLNDLFVPVISKGIVFMHIIIYNRWGAEIFETNGLSVGWEGHNIADGIYFWIVYYTDINGVENKLQGYVTVLK